MSQTPNAYVTLTYENAEITRTQYDLVCWVGASRERFRLGLWGSSKEPGALAQAMFNFLSETPRVSGVLMIWEVRPNICVDRRLVIRATESLHAARDRRAVEDIQWARAHLRFDTNEPITDQAKDQYLRALARQHSSGVWGFAHEHTSGSKFLLHGAHDSQPPQSGEQLYVRDFDGLTITPADVFCERPNLSAVSFVTTRRCRHVEPVWVAYREAQARMDEQTAAQERIRIGRYEYSVAEQKTNKAVAVLASAGLWGAQDEA